MEIRKRRLRRRSRSWSATFEKQPSVLQLHTQYSMLDLLTPHKLLCALLAREYAVAANSDSGATARASESVYDVARLLSRETTLPRSDTCFEPPLATFLTESRRELGARSFRLVQSASTRVRIPNIASAL